MPQNQGPGLLDRLLRPEWSERQIKQQTTETEHLQAQTDFLKAQAKIHQQNYDQIEQMDAYIGKLPIEDQIMWRKSPEIAAMFYKMANRSAPGPQPSPEPKPFQEGQGMLKEFGQPEQPPGVASQISQNLLFGGMSSDDIMADYAKKKFGIGESVEPVQTKDLYNPATGKHQMGQVLRNGQTRWLSDAQGNPLIVPPDVDWRKTVVNGKVVEVGYTKQGKEIPGLVRESVPQDTQFVQGAINNQPASIALPPGGVPPGTAFPGAVRMESVPTTGPRGETGLIQINPYGGGGPSVGGGPAVGGGAPGIQTGPAKAGQVAVSQQIQMVNSGLEGLKKIKDALFDSKTGEINRKNLANAKIGTPWTEGKRLADLYGAALNAIRIASTGAAFSPQELKDLKSQYVADYLANDQQIYEQWDMMTNFLGGMLQQLDPNAVFTSEVQKQFQGLKTIKRGDTGPSAIDLRFKQLANEPWEKVRDTLKKEFGEKVYKEYLGIK